MNKTKNVDAVFYSLTGLSSLQIGLTGEIIKEQIDKGKDYRIVKCDNALTNCHFNQFHNILACSSCQTRMEFIHSKLGIKKEKILKLKRTNPVIDFPFFNNYKEVIEFEYKGINIGRGVASSLISHYRDFNISSLTHKNFIEFELHKSAIVVDNFLSILEKIRPKEFYIFNGRFAEVHPLVEICKQKNITFFTIESGSKHKYEYHKNCLPHNITQRTIKMHKLWEETDQTVRLQVSNDWFIKKRKGDETYSKSFKQSGKDNRRIEEVLSRDKKNVLILNSSEDEVKVIKEWEHDLYDSQNEAISKIVNHYEKNSSINFILRVHPNLKIVDNKQTNEIKNFNFSNLSILQASEEIDTYELIDQVDLVIVFGSSTGIEANYWGKPTILFGKSFYEEFEVCHQPNNYDELFKLIENDSLKAFPQVNCLKYSYYIATRGNELKWFVPKGKSKSTFMGSKIPVVNFKSLVLLFKYFNSFHLWKKLIKIAYNRRIKIKDVIQYKLRY